MSEQHCSEQSLKIESGNTVFNDNKLRRAISYRNKVFSKIGQKVIYYKRLITQQNRYRTLKEVKRWR